MMTSIHKANLVNPRRLNPSIVAATRLATRAGSAKSSVTLGVRHPMQPDLICFKDYLWLIWSLSF